MFNATNKPLYKIYPYMAKVLLYWGVINRLEHFDIYVSNLANEYPEEFKEKVNLIFNNFLKLEESVADYDLYHRHGIISAYFMTRLIKHFPKYNLSDIEKFEMITSSLVHDCEYNKLTIHELIDNFFIVHCNSNAFYFLFRNTGIKTIRKINIGKLIKETIYMDKNKWLYYSIDKNRFLLGENYYKFTNKNINKTQLKEISIVLADIVGQLNAPNHDKMVKKYLCKLNPNISPKIPKAFIDLYDKMCDLWDVNILLSSEEIKRFEFYRKNTD